MFQTHQQNLDQIEATRRKLELPRAIFDELGGKATKRIKRHEANIRRVDRNTALLSQDPKCPPAILSGFAAAIEYNQACITFIRFLQEV
jgi:hypothetical protein